MSTDFERSYRTCKHARTSKHYTEISRRADLSLARLSRPGPGIYKM